MNEERQTLGRRLLRGSSGRWEGKVHVGPDCIRVVLVELEG